MAISKVILNGVTQMDLTQDTVTAATLMSPETAHGADGVAVVGTASGSSALDAYPVGSIYMSSDSTSPASLFGGNWSPIKDTFLLTAGDTYTAGNTGGSATQTLTASQLPTNMFGSSGQGLYTYEKTSAGSAGILSWAAPTSSSRYSWKSASGGTVTYNIYKLGGSGAAHNNMPPYRVVYAWERIS